ncbi:MAG: hypothetical protein BWY52_00804 [Chloroflexi bacterium ADurb.Bin325]|nr:MAG: hypothetical protein BWY52_00804 [Chloroflexi bacterium ADurb.Bin325]
MRFSLRTMTSGAPSSSSRLSRLLRLITRRYRSFRSLVAKRPPSNCTIGRSSGGSTGSRVRIIHSGRLPLLRNDSATRSRLAAFFLRCFDAVVAISLRSSLTIVSRSIFATSSRIASAPMPARKTLPHRSASSRYWLSVSRSRSRSSLSSWSDSFSAARICAFCASTALRCSSTDCSASRRMRSRRAAARLRTPSCSRLMFSSMSLSRRWSVSLSVLRWSRVTVTPAATSGSSAGAEPTVSWPGRTNVSGAGLPNAFSRAACNVAPMPMTSLVSAVSRSDRPASWLVSCSSTSASRPLRAASA